MPVQGTTQDRKRLDAAVKRLRELAALVVDVGSMGPSGGPTEAFRPRPNRDGSRPASPGPVAQVLAFHELARGRRVPRRSVIAATLADPATQSHLDRLRRQIATQAIVGAGKVTLDPLGKFAIEQMRRRIMARIPPPLGPWAARAAGLVAGRNGKTRRRKGLLTASLRDRRLIPLYDTRQIWQSLRYHTRRGGVA